VRCLTSCSPGARCASGTSDTPASRAPVQQLLGAVMGDQTTNRLFI
jgi:hypothetical protein